GAHQRRAGIEEDGVVRIGQSGIEIGTPALDVVLFGEALDLVGIAAHDDRIDHEAIAVGKGNAALIADGQDGAYQMLVIAHAPGDAVHDKSEPSLRHSISPRHERCVTGWLLSYTRGGGCVKRG